MGMSIYSVYDCLEKKISRITDTSLVFAIYGVRTTVSEYRRLSMPLSHSERDHT
jgi:hypothetical protein